MRIEFLLAVANSKTSVSRRLVLAADQCAVGRQDGDLRLSDTLVSRMHALIYFDERGNLKIKDLDSTNGTWVNDQRVSDQLLHKGDEIRIGDTSIVLVQAEAHRSKESPTTEAPPPASEAPEAEDLPTGEHPRSKTDRLTKEGISLTYLRREKDGVKPVLTRLDEQAPDEE